MMDILELLVQMAGGKSLDGDVQLNAVGGVIRLLGEEHTLGAGLL